MLAIIHILGRNDDEAHSRRASNATHRPENTHLRERASFFCFADGPSPGRAGTSARCSLWPMDGRKCRLEAEATMRCAALLLADERHELGDAPLVYRAKIAFV